MHEAAEVSELLITFIEPEALGDVSRIDRDGSRMAGRVPIARIERGNERSSKREVCLFQTRVRVSEVVQRVALFSIHHEEPLRSVCRNKEKGCAPRTQLDIAVCQKANE